METHIGVWQQRGNKEATKRQQRGNKEVQTPIVWNVPLCCFVCVGIFLFAKTPSTDMSAQRDECGLEKHEVASGDVIVNEINKASALVLGG